MPRVLVTVAARPDFNGFWSAQKFWPNGSTGPVDVTDEQLKQLKADTTAGHPIGVAEIPDEAPPAPVAPPPPAPTPPADDSKKSKK